MANRSRASASAPGPASMALRPFTSASAFPAAIPARRPARKAALSAASTTRRLPSWPISTSGISTGGTLAPRFRLTRSVGQVGRYSETTLGIAGLHFEIRALAGAASDQFDRPPGAADARNGQLG